MSDSQVLEDIAYLKKVIEDSRKVVIDNGVIMLTWGILVVVGMILTYAYIHFGLKIPETWLWIVLIGIGWILSFWIGWTNSRTSESPYVCSKSARLNLDWLRNSYDCDRFSRNRLRA